MDPPPFRLPQTFHPNENFQRRVDIILKSPGAKIRILGIDPGSRATGYGLIDKDGDRLRFVACGVIRTSPRLEFAVRLREIHDGLCEVMGKQQPDLAAVEEVFMARNPMSALKLGHARGVAMLAACRHGLEVREYSARSIKQAVTGYGQAGKEQVQQMVRALLQLAANPSQDAADALAVALCHANHCNLLAGCDHRHRILPQSRHSA
jgi:crossover junction endodeoxyribonuclease RuvC